MKSTNNSNNLEGENARKRKIKELGVTRDHLQPGKKCNK